MHAPLSVLERIEFARAIAAANRPVLFLDLENSEAPFGGDFRDTVNLDFQPQPLPWVGVAFKDANPSSGLAYARHLVQSFERIFPRKIHEHERTHHAIKLTVVR
jgi:hypothetical protein